MESEREQGDTAAAPSAARRAVCPKCDRPLSVCLCNVIPSPPIPTATQIVIIQHPHESQHKLNTTPFLTKSLLNSTTVVTRRLTAKKLSQSPDTKYYYLFPPTPSTPALTLSDVREKECDAGSGAVVLIVFDGTWQQAREMVRSSEEYLGKFATRVSLDGFDDGVEGGSIYDSELVLRKEPCGGCVSTLEAVARWLGAVEENGPEIEERLLGILKEMVRLQAQFLKPMKPRPKLLKKKKIGSDEQIERGL